MSGRSIAFFDFDGTITDRDIFWDYIRYRRSKGLANTRLLLCTPAFIRYALGIWTNEAAKEHIFGILFRGEPIADFVQGINDYSGHILPSRLRKKAIDRINWHKQNGDDVYVVSANFDLLLAHFAAEYGLKLISTKLAIKDDMLTGKFSTHNCYGEEKVSRIQKEVTGLHLYDHIYCYGDSKGDLQMLEMATYKFYKPFRPE